MSFSGVKSAISAAAYYIPLVPRIGTRYKPSYGELSISDFFLDEKHIRTVRTSNKKRLIPSTEINHFWYGTLARCAFWANDPIIVEHSDLFGNLIETFTFTPRIPVVLCVAAALFNNPRIRAAGLAAAADAAIKGYRGYHHR